MNENFTYWSDLVDKKLQNKLSEQDSSAFDALITENPEFKKFYETQKQFAQGIKMAERLRLKESLKMQLQEETESASTAKSRFSYIFWLSQYSAAIWLITISIVITLSSVLLYRTWQQKQRKNQIALQWQKAEELLEEPNKKQEVILSKPDSPITHNASPANKETTVNKPVKPAPRQNFNAYLSEKAIIPKNKNEDNDKKLLADDVVIEKKEKTKTEDEVKTKTNNAEIPAQVLSGIVEEDKVENEKKSSAKLKKQANKEEIVQNSSIKEFYLPVYALRIQDEVQNKNFTATPEQIRSGKDMPRSTKSTTGPKIFVTQYTDKKVQEDNVWYYDFTRDSAGEHLFIYADFELQSLQLYIDRNPSPVKYYLKTKKGVFALYPNQTQKLAELVTDKKILKYIE